MALFVFFILALFGYAHWILNLWTIVAGASVVLSGIAAIRFGVANGDAAVDESGFDVGSRREITSDLT
jgi:hypothetical protein